MRGMRVSALLVAVLASCKPSAEKPVSPDPEPSPSASATSASRPARPPEQILAEIDPGKGFQYFATAGGNHPTIYLDRQKKEFVVVGRERSLGGGTKQVARFPADKPVDALAVYHRQLIQVGYEPHDAPPKAKKDPNEMVAVPSEDLFGGGGPDRSGAFTTVEADLLYETAPSKAWPVFSGKDHPTNDYPAMTAAGTGLTVYGRGLAQEFAWDKSRDAFAAYTKLVSGK
jgi:hypothetical protein